MWEKVLLWEEAGTMRRDCGGGGGGELARSWEGWVMGVGVGEAYHLGGCLGVTRTVESVFDDRICMIESTVSTWECEADRRSWRWLVRGWSGIGRLKLSGCLMMPWKLTATAGVPQGSGGFAYRDLGGGPCSAPAGLAVRLSLLIPDYSRDELGKATTSCRYSQESHCIVHIHVHGMALHMPM